MSEDDIDHAMNIMDLKHDAENDLRAKVERLEKELAEAKEIGDDYIETLEGELALSRDVHRLSNEAHNLLLFDLEAAQQQVTALREVSEKLMVTQSEAVNEWSRKYYASVRQVTALREEFLQAGILHHYEHSYSHAYRENCLDKVCHFIRIALAAAPPAAEESETDLMLGTIDCTCPVDEDEPKDDKCPIHLFDTPPAAEETLTCICATDSDLTCPAHPSQPETACPCKNPMESPCGAKLYSEIPKYFGGVDIQCGIDKHLKTCKTPGCKDGKIQVTEGTS